MVPRVRIELTLPKEHDFESCASTSSATEAMMHFISLMVGHYQVLNANLRVSDIS